MVSKTVIDLTKLQVRTSEGIFKPIKQALEGERNIELPVNTTVKVESTRIMGKTGTDQADNAYYKVVSIEGYKLPSQDVYIKGRDVRDSS